MSAPQQYQLPLRYGCVCARSRALLCSMPHLKLRSRTQSTERAWYNWGETGLCMPHVTDAWMPRVYFRHAPAHATHLMFCQGLVPARDCAMTARVAQSALLMCRGEGIHPLCAITHVACGLFLSGVDHEWGAMRGLRCV